MTIAPSRPMRAASRTMSIANADVNSAMPLNTGTRPRATAFAASITPIFSPLASEVLSPTVPQTISPDTPSRINPSMTRAVASMSREKSSRNCVVTAGKNPFQWHFKGVSSKGLRRGWLLAWCDVRVELAAEELVEVLHSVLHRRLVGSFLAAAHLVERAATRVHPLGDLVVLRRRLEVRRLLGRDEFPFEEGNVLGIVELDDVGRAVGRTRVERADHEHVRIPLEHHVRIVGEPDRAVLRRLAARVVADRPVPALVGLGSGLGEARDADRLQRRPRRE